MTSLTAQATILSESIFDGVEKGEYIFSSKEKAMAFKKEVRKAHKASKFSVKNLSVRKTKGWSTHSAFIEFNSYGDKVAFGQAKLYVPEKSHYKDIRSK